MLEILVIVISFIGLILQSSFFDYYSLLGVKPDIVLTCIVFYAIFKGPLKGGIMGGITGLIEDLFLGQFIGPMFILRIILGIGVGYFGKNIYKESIILPIIILLIATFISNAFQWIFISITEEYVSWMYFIKVTILQGAFNMIFMPFFYLIKIKVLSKENRG